MDARLMKEYLLRSNEPFDEVRTVHTKEEYEEALQTFSIDLILSDYRLVNFNGLQAIKMKNSYAAETPIIIVSATVGEEKAVELIREGAVDFLIKNNAESRLAQISMRAIRESIEKKKRREAEIERKKMKRHYKMLFSSSMDGILIGSPSREGEIIDANTAICELLGYSHEEITTLKRRDLFQISSDDLDKLMQEREHTQNNKFRGELELKHKEGHLIPVEVTSRIVEMREGEKRSYSILRDIRERKKAQRQLEWDQKVQQLHSDIAQIINQTVDVKISIENCLERINDFLGWSLSHIYVWNSENDESFYESLAVWAAPNGEEFKPFVETSTEKTFSVDEGLVGKVACNNQLLEFEAQQQKEFMRTEEAEQSKLSAGLMLPIIVGGQTEAVLEFYNTQEEKLNSAQKDVLQTVALQIARLIERKRHLAEVENEKERYRLMAANSTDMISRHTPEGEYVYVSPASQQIMGYTPEELIGESAYDYFHRNDLEKIKEAHQTILDDPDTHLVSYRIKQKDGGWRWVETTSKTLRDSDGEVYEIQTSTRDISDRKKYEQELERQVRLNRNILNSLPELFFIISADQKIERVNDQFRGTLGYGIEDLSEMSPTDFITEEDKEAAQLAIEKAFKEGSVEVELTLQAKGGQKVPYIISGTVRELDGQAYLLGAGINISDRIQAEENLKKEKALVDKVINSIPGLFYVLDDENNYIRVNNDFLKDLGYSREELEDMSPLDFYLEEDHEKVISAIQKAFSDGEANLTARVKTKDGSLPYYYLTGAHFLQDGKDYILGTGIDITEQKKLEDLLQQSHEIARIGAWELDLVNDELSWDSITKQIHEVESDFEPELESALDFYKEGESRETIQRVVNEAIENGTSYDVELHITTAKGNDRWVRAIGQTEFKEGKCTKLYGSFQDIHDRKQAEEEVKNKEQLLQAMMDQASAVIYVKDSDGIFRFVNERFRTIFGMEDSNIVGEADSEVLTKYHIGKREEIKRIQELDREVLKSGQTVEAEKTLTVDSAKRTFLTSKVPLKNIKGYQNCVCTILTEITDRKTAEDRLRESLHEKEILLMEVHHRVKNNLAIISSIMQLQAFDMENDEAFEALMNSQSRIQSIAIIHELLYQSKSFSQVNLDDKISKLVYHIVTSIQASADIELDLSISNIELNVNQAIPCALIINELLTNVYKYAFEGHEEGKVEISLKKKEQLIELKIKDNGIGLPEEINIEQPESLGLKLVTVLGQQLEGELTFTSEKDAGTEVTLAFKQQNKKGSSSSLVDASYE